MCGKYVYTLIRVIFEFIIFLAEGSEQKLKQPRYGQIKRADTPINEIVSLSNNQIM